MSVTFAYPTVASPTVSVVLGDHEMLPSSRPRRIRQTVFETDAGDQVIYDWGSSSREWNLRLWPLTLTERDNLENFFYLAEGSGGVNGRAGAWEFQDSAGTTYSVRFGMDVFDAVARTSSLYEVTVTLRER